MENEYCFIIYELEEDKSRKNITVVVDQEEVQAYIEYLKKTKEYYNKKSLVVERVEIYNSEFDKICENCGKPFRAKARNQIYCVGVDDEDRVCKRAGYDKKISKDEALELYRRQYRNRLAKKNKNLGNYITVDRYYEWDNAAKEKARQYKHGEIKKEEFKTWLENN